jgi:outer membrane receptor protein involved in Fe transport
LEAVWNPSPQISLVAGYAYLDSVITKDFSRPENIGLRSLAYKHAGQFLIKYSIPDGKLKGLTAGMSTVIRGELSVSEGSQEFKPIPAYVVANPFLGYQWRLSNGNYMRVALNVTNIFNHEYMKNYARFGEPRSYVLSTSLKF